MTNKRTEQVRELLNNPRSGLKDSSDTNKTRMEILAIVSELEDELEGAKDAWIIGSVISFEKPTYNSPFFEAERVKVLFTKENNN